MKRKRFIKILGLSVVATGFPALAFSGKKDMADDPGKCKKAWEELCGNRAGDKAFQYIEPGKGIPNVFLYGDSISIGYTETVRSKLNGKANVFRLFRNGGSSRDFIGNMEQQRKAMFAPFLKGGWDFEWDLIHFNVGLHDLKYVVDGKLDKINGVQVTPLNIYKDNLREICKYLKSNYPQTQLIFATTTPVPEGEPGRIAEDVWKYNEAALEVLSDYPTIKINDLYTFTKPQFDLWSIKAGNVHYNLLGREEQGKEVARIISENLGL